MYLQPARHSIWEYTNDSSKLGLSRKEKEDSWCKYTSHILQQKSIICNYHHRKKKENNVTPSRPNNALFKTQMCYHWLSGCYMGDRCPYAHRVEDLFHPYYASEVPRVCKEICSTVCEDPEEECLFFGNNSMSNKLIQVHMPKHFTRIPYCSVTCKKCQTSKIIEIYSHTTASSR